MVRKIQLAASSLGAIFGVGALFDVLTLGTGSDSMLFYGWKLVPLMLVWESVVLGITLTTTTIGAVVSVVMSNRALSKGDQPALVTWRYIIWGLSIIESAGCLIFAIYGSLLYLPSAVALFIAGVGELAVILHEVEHKTRPISRPRHIIP